MDKYDVCIIGGGISGCACAYTASKLGLKTILIEKNNYLGGLMTGGLVVPVMKNDSSNINIEFYSDLINYAKKYNAQIEYKDGNKGWFNPNILKIVLDEMLTDKNVEILFEANPISVKYNQNHVAGIEISTKILSLYIEAKYFLDSTGDSKIFQLLNEEFFEKNLKKQPASLRFIMENINLDEFDKFLSEIDKDESVTNSYKINNQIHLTTACTWDDKKWALKPLFDKAVEQGELKPFDTAYFQLFTIPYAKKAIAFNCPRMADFDQNDPFENSNAIIEARKAIYRLSKFMTKNFKGFENAYISQIADMTGYRETNRIIAKKQFTIDDMLNKSMPKNPVLQGDYPIDIHSNEKNSSKLIEVGKYYLEINSLISKNYENLFAAGRNLGADSKAFGALRTQSSCMSMGEAVAKYIFEKINKN